MKKKMLLVALFILLSGCSRSFDAESVKSEVRFSLNEESPVKNEDSHLYVVGRYGNGYVVFGEFATSATLGETTGMIIDGVRLTFYNGYSPMYFYKGQLYELEEAFFMDYIYHEDLLDVKNKLEECNKLINKDYNTYIPSNRCEHENKIVDISNSTCHSHGISNIVCEKCNKVLKVIEKSYSLHNYELGICNVCNETEFERLELNDEFNTQVEQTFNLNILSWLGGYKYNGKELNIYYTGNLESYSSSMLSLKRVIVDNLSFCMLIDESIDVILDGNKYSLSDAFNQGIINKNILFEIHSKYVDENLCGNLVYENYDNLLLKKYDKNYFLNYGENEQELYELYLNYLHNIYYVKYPKGELNFYGYHLGVFNNAIVAYIDDGCSFTNSYVLEDITFKSDILVLKDNQIYDIKKAYETNIVSKDNLIKISENYAQILKD